MRVALGAAVGSVGDVVGAVAMELVYPVATAGTALARSRHKPRVGFPCRAAEQLVPPYIPRIRIRILLFWKLLLCHCHRHLPLSAPAYLSRHTAGNEK